MVNRVERADSMLFGPPPREATEDKVQMSGVKLIVIGPTGSGKSTVGKAVATKLGLEYIDGDSLQPKSNIDKISRGIPLSDQDRRLWVTNIIAELEHKSVVIGAALLKRNFRNRVHDAVGGVRFAQLIAPISVLRNRINEQGSSSRKNSLHHQLPILDLLGRLEPGHIYDATKSVADLTTEIVTDLKTN